MFYGLSKNKNGQAVPDIEKLKPFTDTENGIAINSEFLNGLETKDAIEKAIQYVEENNIGKRKTNYKIT